MRVLIVEDEPDLLSSLLKALREDGYAADGAPDGEVMPSGEVVFPFDPALRNADVAAVPVRRTGSGPLIRERYRIDRSGIVQVTITDLESGFAREFRLGS